LRHFRAGRDQGWRLANNNVLVVGRLLPDNRSRPLLRSSDRYAAMLTSEQINDLHRLYWSEHWPVRKIERHLKMGWRTIKKYLDAPAQGVSKRQRHSKLDPFKANVADWLEKDPQVTAAVIHQRLIPLGYSGGDSLTRRYVRNVRPQLSAKRAFVRMEPLAEVRHDPTFSSDFSAIARAK
jgi:hypothetical protein